MDSDDNMRIQSEFHNSIYEKVLVRVYNFFEISVKNKNKKQERLRL